MTGPVTVAPLLEVRGLAMHFPVSEGIVLSRKIGDVKAVDGVDFTINRGETLGLVGESGCGKTTTGRCILRLERPTAGEILFDGRDVNRMQRGELVALRRRMQVIFQDPYSSLNPRMKVGDIIAEPIKVHGVEPDAARRRARVRELLAICGLDPKFTDRYPHEMSGGQRQRVGIARDGRRLPFRALERRHIGRRNSLRVRRNVVLGELELAHGTPPVGSALRWHTDPAFSRS